MSYENAEPKILKTLNSDGQVLDDSGNVINESSDYWVQLYNQTEPKVDKILHSDGSITDSEGNTIQNSTPFNVKKYTQAEPIPAKYLHSDGTIDENPGSGGGGGEKASAYVWKVEYYHEYDTETYCFRLNFDKVTENLNIDDICYLYVQSSDNRAIFIQKLTDNELFSNKFDFTITKVSDSEFKLNCKYNFHGEITDYEYIFTRGYEPFKDITLWELSE